MSARFFYADLLAAAWMAKHHGMRFQALYDNEYDNRDLDTVDDILSSGHSVDLSIHPDSLHLLEPQVGDIIITVDERPTCLDEGDVEHLKRNGYTRRIIQRNGIAFHWPESEAA